MAKLYITQYARKGRDDRGPTDAGEEPSLGTIVVDFTAGATNSAPLVAGATMLRLFTDTACQFAFGKPPAVGPTSTPMPANSVDYFAISPDVNKGGTLLLGVQALA